MTTDNDKTAQERKRFEAAWATIRERTGVDGEYGFERAIAETAWQARAALDTGGVKIDFHPREGSQVQSLHRPPFRISHR
ncbi:hypothetical protein V5F44_20485 [Xanthobacter sp. V2C-8]|uniref:hypothetical protein n=1 Tax=Xanthobacter albus TaxID=3119929 RepID=UPI0037278270